jgi:dTDP-4-dehydrorhamnose reductase
MRVLVTGGSELVGSNVLAAARQQSWQALAWQGELADRRACVELAGRWEPDVIVHAAGEGSLSRFERDPFVGQREFVAAEHTLAAARHVRARYVLISSDQVYRGALPAGWCAHEGDLPDPVNAHGRSKLAGEEATMRSNVSWLIVRPGEVYGVNASICARGGAEGGAEAPSARVEDDDPPSYAAEAWWRSGTALRLVARLRRRAMLPAPAQGLRSPTYAWDFAERLCELIAQGCEGVYNLAGPAALDRLSWARLLAREFECRSELVCEGTPEAYLRACGEREAVRLPGNVALSDEKSRAAIGTAAVTPERGLALTRAALGETRLPAVCDAR